MEVFLDNHVLIDEKAQLAWCYACKTPMEPEQPMSKKRFERLCIAFEHEHRHCNYVKAPLRQISWHCSKCGIWEMVTIPDFAIPGVVARRRHAHRSSDCAEKWGSTYVGTPRA